MILRRVVLIVTFTFAGLAIQTAVLGDMALLGAKPELLLLVVVAVALTDGPAAGAITGFVAGFATDLLLVSPRGITALTFTLAGYAVGRIRAQMMMPSAWLPMAMVGFATLASVLFYGGMLFMLGQEGLVFLLIVRRALLAAAYNALLTPFVFPMVRALGTFARPRSEVIR